jgi:hypothetical protein
MMRRITILASRIAFGAVSRFRCPQTIWAFPLGLVATLRTGIDLNTSKRSRCTAVAARQTLHMAVEAKSRSLASRTWRERALD